MPTDLEQALMGRTITEVHIDKDREGITFVTTAGPVWFYVDGD